MKINQRSGFGSPHPNPERRSNGLARKLSVVVHAIVNPKPETLSRSSNVDKKTPGYLKPSGKSIKRRA